MIDFLACSYMSACICILDSLFKDTPLETIRLVAACRKSTSNEITAPCP